MSTTIRNATLAAVTVFSPGATGAVAAGGDALSAAQDPTQSAYGGTGTAPGYPRGRFVFSGAFGSAPSTNGSVQIFYRLPADGTLTGSVTTWETYLGSSTTPVRAVAAVIPLDATNAAQARASAPVDIPAQPFEVIVVNASGQSLSAGWSLSVVPETEVGG